MNTTAIFLNKVKKDLSKNNIKFVRIPRRYIVDECGTYSGHFDEINRELWVATGSPISEWLAILVHEYSHFKQWKYNVEAWGKACFPVGTNRDAYSVFFNWLAGSNKINKEKVTHAMRLVRNNELDCDKRAIKLIKKYNLPIDINMYKKTTIGYTYFYTWVMKSRAWTPSNKKPAYRRRDILRHIKGVQLSRDYDNLPKELEKVFDSYLRKDKNAK